VRGFGRTNGRCAAGPGATAGGQRAATFAQRLWRFCDNDRVGFAALIAPFVQRVRDEAPAAGVLLAVHDWSTVAFGSHPSKADRRRLTHDADVGYDLGTVLVVRGSDGATLAPVSVRLATADGVLGTDADDADDADVPHVDQVRGRMDAVAGLRLGGPVVHVIDREADSVGHWRDWHAAGHHAVVRTDDRVVLRDGRETRLSAVADALPLADAGAAGYRGRPARRFVGEAAVVLHRPAKRWEGSRRRVIAGEPLAVRLVVAELRDADGRALARWWLLTNVPAETADAAAVASWYYWRWRIESFHKLLKAAGWELEKWLQRTGERVLRKLLVAIAAVVEVWALERRTDAASDEFRRLLMTLSGRQTKRRVPVTTTGLLAGLWVLQQAASWLARDGPDDPNALLEKHLPLFAQARRQV
jgi:Transposase DDE domain